MSDNQAVIKVFEEAFDLATKQNLQATANLLADLMESHGKFVWMLRSYLETSPGLAKEEVEEEPEIIEETEEEIVEESTEEIIEETTED